MNQYDSILLFIIIIIIIIIIKTSSIGPSRKHKAVYNSFRNPTRTCITEKENATQGSDQPLTAQLNLSSVPVSNSVGVIPHSNLSWQERPSKSGRFTP